MSSFGFKLFSINKFEWIESNRLNQILNRIENWIESDQMDQIRPIDWIRLKSEIANAWKPYVWKLTEIWLQILTRKFLTKKVKTIPFLGSGVPKWSLLNAWSGWHVPGHGWQVPGSLASALASAWDAFGASKKAKTSPKLAKTGIFWSFWDQKIDQILPQSDPERLRDVSRPMLKALRA